MGPIDASNGNLREGCRDYRLGSIGEEIARKASFFGMRVLGVRKNPQPMKYVDQVYGIEEMDAVFQQCDYIINLLPLTAGTQKLIDKRFFASMKKTACFINIGRGPTVNQADLVDALKSNQIGGLVADVYEEEPLPEDSPLWKLENVILAPHIAGLSPNYLKRAMDIIRHNLKVYVSQSGEMMNIIDCSSGYLIRSGFKTPSKAQWLRCSPSITAHILAHHVC